MWIRLIKESLEHAATTVLYNLKHPSLLHNLHMRQMKFTRMYKITYCPHFNWGMWIYIYTVIHLNKRKFQYLLPFVHSFSALIIAHRNYSIAGPVSLISSHADFNHMPKSDWSTRLLFCQSLVQYCGYGCIIEFASSFTAICHGCLLRQTAMSHDPCSSSTYASRLSSTLM